MSVNSIFHPSKFAKKFIVPLENYQQVLNKLLDQEALVAVNTASDIDESEFNEHSDHENDSEIDTNVVASCFFYTRRFSRC
ncbi:hypothetical protein AVEN_161583-1 [Araneus ventricosus]|uniref:Uncharacterized protein n=1 Tax=Araneus ventricosus TaxID=182803 RepID=A0A4Y2FK87_ARAVE|nr:hypothetical protein AVEN_161583-1 [Araneus ventricosus]